MSNGKNRENKKVDFNDEDSLNNIIKEISKDKNKNGKANLPEKIIGLFTKNMGVTAALAIYFILCGIVGNIMYIVKNPIPAFIVCSAIIIGGVINFKLKSKKSTSRTGNK